MFVTSVLPEVTAELRRGDPSGQEFWHRQGSAEQLLNISIRYLEMHGYGLSLFAFTRVPISPNRV